MRKFTAELDIIGINPFVFVPEDILSDLFEEAGKSKGPIPIQGTVNERAYQQTLVKYSGNWRLYINTKMLDDSPKRIGEQVAISIAYDPSDRTIKPHLKLVRALAENMPAKLVFDGLTTSKQQEIVRYISNLKTEESVDKNVKRAIRFLLGEESFVGRKQP